MARDGQVVYLGSQSVSFLVCGVVLHSACEAGKATRKKLTRDTEPWTRVSTPPSLIFKVSYRHTAKDLVPVKNCTPSWRCARQCCIRMSWLSRWRIGQRTWVMILNGTIRRMTDYCGEGRTLGYSLRRAYHGVSRLAASTSYSNLLGCRDGVHIIRRGE